MGVSSEAELDTALQCFTALSGGGLVVNLTANILLSTPKVIANASGASLTINGNNHVVDGQGAVRVFEIRAGTTASMDAIMLTNGRASDEITQHFIYAGGGNIWNLGTLTLSRCVVSNGHTGTYGGGVLNASVLRSGRRAQRIWNAVHVRLRHLRQCRAKCGLLRFNWRGNSITRDLSLCCVL